MAHFNPFPPEEGKMAALPHLTEGKSLALCLYGASTSIQELQLKIPPSGDFAAPTRYGRAGQAEDTLPGVPVSSLIWVSGCQCDKNFNLMDTVFLSVAFCQMGQ